MLERAGTGAFDHTLHGGPGVGRVQWHFHERTRLPVAVQTWRLPPGAAEGSHAHPDGEPLEELYLVVEGRGCMRVGDEEYDVGAGDAVLAPVGADHELHNPGDPGDDVLTVVVVWGRPAPPPDYSSFGMDAAAREARAAGANGRNATDG